MRSLVRFCLFFSSLMVMSGELSAQQTDSTAVLLATGRAPEVATSGSAMQRVVRLQRSKLALDREVITPPVNLDDIQLAVGCSGLTPACLDRIAWQLQVQDLLVPIVDRAGERVVLSLMRFERSEGRLREAVREITPISEADLLEPLEGMLRELYDLSPGEQAAAATELRASEEATPQGPTQSSPNRGSREAESSFPVVPVVIGAAGLAAFGVGAVFAVSAGSTQSEYESAPASTADDIDRLRALESTGSTQTALANVFLGAGLVAIASGAVLLFVVDGEPREDEGPTLALQPQIGRDRVGLALSGQWGK